ncbi:hypothetical protein pb186bvf_009634 [Paramecium bursaria]
MISFLLNFLPPINPSEIQFISIHILTIYFYRYHYRSSFHYQTVLYAQLNVYIYQRQLFDNISNLLQLRLLFMIILLVLIQIITLQPKDRNQMEQYPQPLLEYPQQLAYLNLYDYWQCIDQQPKLLCMVFQQFVQLSKWSCNLFVSLEWSLYNFIQLQCIHQITLILMDQSQTAECCLMKRKNQNCF